MMSEYTRELVNEESKVRAVNTDDWVAFMIGVVTMVDDDRDRFYALDELTSLLIERCKQYKRK